MNKSKHVCAICAGKIGILWQIACIDQLLAQPEETHTSH